MTELTKERRDELAREDLQHRRDHFTAFGSADRAAYDMALRTHDAEQRAERAESLVAELLPYTHSDGRTPADLKIRAREVLATPREGEQRPPGTDANERFFRNNCGNRQQPEDALSEDALAAFDRLLVTQWIIGRNADGSPKIPERAKPDVEMVRRHLAGGTPCPHVRTSDGGTSYCTLAEEGSAVPEEVRRLPERWRANRAEDLPIGSKEQREYKNACDDCATELESALAAAPTKGGEA